MRKLILFFLLSYSAVSFAQDNAYLLSKKIIKIEKGLSDGSIQPGDEQVEKVLGLIVWYADKQDADSSTKANFFATQLDRYPQLNKRFKSIRDKFVDSAKIDNLSLSDFEVFLKLNAKTIKRDNQTEAVKTQLRNVLTQKAAINTELTGLKKKNSDRLEQLNRAELEIKEIKSDTSKVVRAIKNRELELQTLGQSPATDSGFKQLKDSLARLVNSLDDFTELQKDLRDDFDRTLLEVKAKQNERVKLNVEINAIRAQNNALIQLLNSFLSKFKFESFAKDVVELGSEKSTVTETMIVAKQIAEQEAEERTLLTRLPSEAAMIDALAIYLAKRVKQESVMWFFETIKRNASTYDLIQTFFPTTITLLQSNEIYEIPNLGSQWRYALSKDFLMMPKNVFKSDWFKKWFPRDSDPQKILYSYLEAGFEIADLIIQRYDYKSLVKQMYLQLNKAKIDSSIESRNLMPKDFFGLLYAYNQECYYSQKVGGDSIKTRLLGYEDYLSMSKDEIEIMLSLIDLKYGNCISKFFTKGILSLKVEQVNSMRQWLGGIEAGITQFRKLQTQFVRTQEAFNKGDVKDIIYSQFNVWENLYGLFDLILPDSSSRPRWMLPLNKNVENIKKVTKQSFDIYNQLTVKNFAGAVNSTIELLEGLFYSNNKTFVIRKDSLLNNLSGTDEISALYDKLISKMDTSAIVSFRQQGYEASVVFERDRHAIQLIRKLAGFLNDVMLTTDSKKLAKVVESYALPPGSYKRKRNSWWSLDLNAFVGGFAGFEFARNGAGGNAGKKSEGWVYGVTAPIGLSFSKTFGRKLDLTRELSPEYIRNPDKLRLKKDNIYYRSNTTFTLTASIVDIGAVVSYRFRNIADSILPQKPTWSQVFSPGVSFSVALKNTPLVFNLGYQYTPQLRRINSASGEKLELNANRISAGVLFDLPLLNLAQKSYIPAKRRKLTKEEISITKAKSKS